MIESSTPFPVMDMMCAMNINDVSMFKIMRTESYIFDHGPIFVSCLLIEFRFDYFGFMNPSNFEFYSCVWNPFVFVL
jgi:hypothetical protein